MNISSVLSHFLLKSHAISKRKSGTEDSKDGSYPDIKNYQLTWKMTIYTKNKLYYITREIQCKKMLVLATPSQITLSNSEKKSWPYCTFLDVSGSFNKYYSSWKNWKVCWTISACLKYNWAITINIHLSQFTGRLLVHFCCFDFYLLSLIIFS